MSTDLPSPSGTPYPRLPDPGRAEYETAYVEPTEHVFMPQPTAWQSIPGAVRFSVWLWAVLMILGAVFAAFWFVVMVLGGGWALLHM